MKSLEASKRVLSLLDTACFPSMVKDFDEEQYKNLPNSDSDMDLSTSSQEIVDGESEEEEDVSDIESQEIEASDDEDEDAKWDEIPMEPTSSNLNKSKDSRRKPKSAKKIEDSSASDTDDDAPRAFQKTPMENKLAVGTVVKIINGQNGVKNQQAYVIRYPGPASVLCSKPDSQMDDKQIKVIDIMFLSFFNHKLLIPSHQKRV